MAYIRIGILIVSCAEIAKRNLNEGMGTNSSCSCLEKAISDKETTMNIYDYIPEGKENAVTREQLCFLTGLPDRQNRKLIELAQKDGFVILNDQDGQGYYTTSDPDILCRYYFQERSRALATLARLTPLRRKLRKAGRL